MRVLTFNAGLAALLCLSGLLCAQEPSKPHQARSVHLQYQGPSQATVFYNEVTVPESVPGSYFMVCGFRHGYFGIQELAPGHKRILFSVWEAGTQNDQSSVPVDQRVELVDHADDVHVGRFGGEGTGGQSFLDYDWKTGQTYKFMVKAVVEGTKTSFSAWFYSNETSVWKHLATFRTVTGGAPLSGLYSFIEDFRRDGKSLGERRSALFGNGWVLGTDGQWASLSQAHFTADPTPVDNIDAGAHDFDFYLATGGNTVQIRRAKVHSSAPARPSATGGTSLNVRSASGRRCPILKV